MANQYFAVVRSIYVKIIKIKLMIELKIIRSKERS
jgi:hypothetical protein